MRLLTDGFLTKELSSLSSSSSEPRASAFVLLEEDTLRIRSCAELTESLVEGTKAGLMPLMANHRNNKTKRDQRKKKRRNKGKENNENKNIPWVFTFHPNFEERNFQDLWSMGAAVKIISSQARKSGISLKTSMVVEK